MFDGTPNYTFTEQPPPDVPTVTAIDAWMQSDGDMCITFPCPHCGDAWHQVTRFGLHQHYGERRPIWVADPEPGKAYAYEKWEPKPEPEPEPELPLAERLDRAMRSGAITPETALRLLQLYERTPPGQEPPGLLVVEFTEDGQCRMRARTPDDPLPSPDDSPPTPEQIAAFNRYWAGLADRMYVSPEHQAFLNEHPEHRTPEMDQRTGTGPLPDDQRVFDPWAKLAVPAMKVERLPRTISEFVKDRAHTMGADPAALAWTAIAACAAAIDGRTRLKMKKHDSWSVPPFIWVAVIGDPSSMKTPIIETTWKPLHDLQAADVRQWRAALARWNALPADEKKAQSEPKISRRLISHDGTMEALQVILGAQDRGLAVVRDELSGWLCSFDKYSGGKAGGADRAFFLQSWNGGPETVDRVTRGTTAIENLLLAVIGGIQADRLRQFRDLTDDGLFQRFAPIVTAPANLGTDEVRDPAAVGNYGQLIERLVDLPPMQLELSDDALEVRQRVEKRVQALVRAEPYGARFATWCGKLPGLFGRMCLVLHLIEPPIGDALLLLPPVSKATAELAEQLIFESLFGHAASVYSMIEGGNGMATDKDTRAIASYVLRKHKDRVLASELKRDVRCCRMMTLRDIQQAVSPLIAGGWLGNAGGEVIANPKAWSVNPVVHRQFAGRAREETERGKRVRELILNGVSNDDLD